MANYSQAYGKPNLASLDRELRRQVAQEMGSAPRPDWAGLERAADEVAARIRAAKRDGTF